MITLITGGPGNGKTAYAISEVLEKFKTGGFPLFLWGITDVNLCHRVCPPVASWTQEVPIAEDPTRTRWKFLFPPRSLVVIDECQDVFRVASASKLTPEIMALETHRHEGIDFWLITQKPTQLHPHVRGLVGRHIHLHSNWKGRVLYEWSTVRTPTKADFADAVSRTYSLPASVFTLYSSATAHTKLPRRVPKQLYVLCAVLALMAICGPYFYFRVRSIGQPVAPPVAAAQRPAVGPAPVPKADGSLQSQAAVESSGGSGSAAGRSAPERWRLVSYVYLRVGGEVVHRYWVAESDSGRVARVDGGLCASEGRDAVCQYDGQVVTFRGPRGASGSFSGGPALAQVSSAGVGAGRATQERAQAPTRAVGVLR